MYDIIISLITGIVVAVALMFGIVWWLERIPPKFNLSQTRKGMTFKFRLGVYRGVVNLIRNENTTYPTVKHGDFGWNIYFPNHWTDDRMCQEVPHLAQVYDAGGWHEKDLLIFDQVVNKKNKIDSIFGKLVIPV